MVLPPPPDAQCISTRKEGRQISRCVAYRTDAIFCRKQHPRVARPEGVSMDGLEVIFLMCAAVWLYALLEYF